jgi:hypothetical protein
VGHVLTRLAVSEGPRKKRFAFQDDVGEGDVWLAYKEAKDLIKFDEPGSKAKPRD